MTGDQLDDNHPYIGSETLEGKPLERSTYVTQDEIAQDGVLHFHMQAAPNRHWTIADAARP